jgi:hypothetical protein
MKQSNRSLAAVLFALSLVVFLAGSRQSRESRRVVAKIQPTVNSLTSTESGAELTQSMTMSEVLLLARESLDLMVSRVNDYTARFVKQELDTSGNLGEESELFMKMMPRHRHGAVDAPMRVYLRFDRPDSLKGREVIWGQDLYNGKLAVHEGGLLGLITLYLEPTGFVAMKGQRFPISEIGLTRLVEILIERGEKDANNPDVTVTLTRDHSFDGKPAELIRVQRTKPSDDPNDFSLAEITFDRGRTLILQYRSFGWPKTSAASPPLIESYSYHDLQINVGLTDADFDPNNSAYAYP